MIYNISITIVSNLPYFLYAYGSIISGEFCDQIYIICFPTFSMALFNMTENKKHPLSSKPHLSLEQLCLQWALKLKNGLDEHDVRILAHNSKYCVVGEAWKFSGQYIGYCFAPLIPFIGCSKCIRFGLRMGKIAKVYGRSCTNNLYPIIDLFLDHWNVEHA